MKCMICRSGDAIDGSVSVVLERGMTTVIIRGVPARVCCNCGEYWLSEEVTETILKQAEGAVDRRAEVEILRFAA